MNPQKHSQRSVDDIEELKRMILDDAIDDGDGGRKGRYDVQVNARNNYES